MSSHYFGLVLISFEWKENKDGYWSVVLAANTGRYWLSSDSFFVGFDVGIVWIVVKGSLHTYVLKQLRAYRRGCVGERAIGFVIRNARV